MREDSAFIRCRSCSIPSMVHVDEDWPMIIMVGDFMSKMKSSGSPRFPSTENNGNPKQRSEVTGSKYATFENRKANCYQNVPLNFQSVIVLLVQLSTILVASLQE